MYMRLWWKDARQFWPIWAFLVLVAGAMQVGMDWLASPETRGELLVPMAMSLACLYAFSAGAAAFAGEREAGTLRLLDLLPAPRRVVWMGKVSFAIVTTIALAAVLLAMAAIGPTPRPGALWELPDRTVMRMLGILIVQALAWGMLSSAILPSALLAAVAAIGLTTLSFIGSGAIRERTGGVPWGWDRILPLVVLGASSIVFTWGRRDRRLWPVLRLPFALQFRSPIEVEWTDRPPAGAERPRALVAAPLSPRPAVAASSWASTRPRPRSGLVELRYLFWQAMREGRTTWLFLAAFGLWWTVPLLNRVPVDAFFLGLWNVLIALAAGVSVFGLENRRRTHRFLVHQGARPGLVWLAKLAAWCLGLALIWGPLLYLWLHRPLYPQEGRSTEVVLILPLFFAVSVLCGMAIPRGITAGVVAMVAALLLSIGEGGLVAAKLLPTWGTLVPPAIFLATSWAWSGDWLLDRPAPGRWVRLGLILSGLLTAAFGGYVADRAWGIADAGPIPMPAVWAAASTPLPEDRNAAPLYREAAHKLEIALVDQDNVVKLRPDTPAAKVLGTKEILDLDRNPEIARLIRQAVARPECRFYDPERLTLMGWRNFPPVHALAHAMTAHGYRLLDRGDLAGAWDDIMTLFRMSRQIGQGAAMVQELTALVIERQALGLARQWANAAGQSPDRLRTAMSAYRGLPPMTPPADVVRGEGLLLERTLNLPADDLRDLLAEISGERKHLSTWQMLGLDIISTPWECARARRANRRLTAEFARLAMLEPWQRPEGSSGPEIERQWLEQERTLLFSILQPSFWSYLWSDDRNEVERRALVYVLAVREWQLRHDGRFPDRLEELVPDVLPSLPLDPFSGRPFRYIPFAQAAVRPSAEEPKPRWPEGTRLVYSIGSNGVDDRGLMMGDRFPQQGDMVFPVFPATSKK